MRLVPPKNRQHTALAPANASFKTPPANASRTGHHLAQDLKADSFYKDDSQKPRNRIQ